MEPRGRALTWTPVIYALHGDPLDGRHLRRRRREHAVRRPAVAGRDDPELRDAQRGAGHVAGVALTLAAPHVLVRATVGVVLLRVRCAVRTRHARHWRNDRGRRLAAADRPGAVVHLPDRAWMAGAPGSPPDVHERRLRSWFLFAATIIGCHR